MMGKLRAKKDELRLRDKGQATVTGIKNTSFAQMLISIIPLYISNFLCIFASTK